MTAVEVNFLRQLVMGSVSDVTYGASDLTKAGHMKCGWVPPLLRCLNPLYARCEKPRPIV